MVILESSDLKLTASFQGNTNLISSIMQYMDK